MELINAAKNGDFETAFTLIASKYSVNARDNDKATPLYWSAIRGHAHLCEVLLQAGCDVNARVNWGSSALHAAADRGHLECVQLLINGGVKVDAQNERGDTALHIAAYRGHTEIVHVLVRVGSQLFAKNAHDKTAYEEAVSRGHQQTATFLNLAMQDCLSRHALTGSRPVIGHVTQTVGVTSGSNNSLSSYGTSPTDSVRSSSEDGSHGNGRSYGNGTTETYDRSEATENQEPPSPNAGMVTCQETFDDRFDQCHRSLDMNEKPSPGRYVAYRRSVSVGDRGFSFNIVPKPQPVSSQPAGDRTSSLGTCTQTSSPPTSFSSDPCSYMSVSSLPTDTNERNADGDGDMQTGRPGNGQVGEERRKPSVLCRRDEKTFRSSTGSLLGETTLFNAVEQYAATLHENMLQKNIELEKANQHRQALTKRCKELQRENMDKVDKLQSLSLENAQLRETVERERNRSNGAPEQHAVQNASKDVEDPREAYNVTYVAFQKLLQCVTQCPGVMHQEAFYVYLKQTLAAQRPEQERLQDVPEREWIPGIDFVILGENLSAKPTKGVSSWLSFTIKHVKTRRKLALQMTLPSCSTYQSRGGSASSSFSRQADLQLLSFLQNKGHPNMANVLHSYPGNTERFQKFTSVMAQESAVPLVLPSRTTFIVTQYYGTDLPGFLSDFRLSCDTWTQRFLLHLLYQLLSALEYLRERHIVHRNIQPGTIFLDGKLRAVLGGLEFARSVVNEDGSAIVFRDRQDILAGNSIAWAPELKRAYNNGPGKTQEVCLQDIYHVSDVFGLGLTFHFLLGDLDRGQTSGSSVSQFCGCDVIVPRLSDLLPLGLRCTLGNLIKDTPTSRPTPRQAMVEIGTMLFQSEGEEIRSENSALLHCQARMMKLLAIAADKRNDVSHCEGGDKSTQIQCSVIDLAPEIEVDFLCTISPREYWNAFKDLQQRQRLI